MSGCTIEYILLLRQTADSTRFARVAQLVEHHLAKVGVAGSSPVSRSMIGALEILRNQCFWGFFFCEWDDFVGFPLGSQAEIGSTIKFCFHIVY